MNKIQINGLLDGNAFSKEIEIQSPFLRWEDVFDKLADEHGFPNPNQIPSVDVPRGAARPRRKDIVERVRDIGYSNVTAQADNWIIHFPAQPKLE